MFRRDRLAYQGVRGLVVRNRKASAAHKQQVSDTAAAAMQSLLKLARTSANGPNAHNLVKAVKKGMEDSAARKALELQIASFLSGLDGAVSHRVRANLQELDLPVTVFAYGRVSLGAEVPKDPNDPPTDGEEEPTSGSPSTTRTGKPRLMDPKDGDSNDNGHPKRESPPKGPFSGNWSTRTGVSNTEDPKDGDSNDNGHPKRESPPKGPFSGDWSTGTGVSNTEAPKSLSVQPSSAETAKSLVSSLSTGVSAAVSKFANRLSNFSSSLSTAASTAASTVSKSLPTARFSLTATRLH